MKEKRIENKVLITAAFAVLLLHGVNLFDVLIGIDTEAIIAVEKDVLLGDMVSGRQGLVFLRRVLGLMPYNPYFVGIVTALLLWLMQVLFLRLWRSAESVNVAGAVSACLLWLSSPILAELLYFGVQNVEISLGFCLCAAAAGLSAEGVRRRKILPCLAAAVILQIPFASYQVLVVFYIFAVLTVLVLEFDELQEKVSVMFSACVRHALIFLAAFGLYLLLTQLFFPTQGSYLSDQVYWGKLTAGQIFLRFLDHGFRILSGTGNPHYNLVFGVLVAFTLLLGALRGISRGKGKRPAMLFWWFLVLCLLSTPLWMTAVCGTAPVLRSQLVLPALTGFLGYLTLKWCRRKWVSCCILICCCLGVWTQAQTTLRLYYTDRVCCEQDTEVGNALLFDIERLLPEGADEADYSLVAVGKKPFRPNASCLVGETIGQSLFAWDTDVEPKYYFSSRRIAGFLKVLGSSVAPASVEEVERYRETAEAMPVWPAEGSIFIEDKTIVVHIGEE